MIAQYKIMILITVGIVMISFFTGTLFGMFSMKKQDETSTIKILINIMKASGFAGFAYLGLVLVAAYIIDLVA